MSLKPTVLNTDAVPSSHVLHPTARLARLLHNHRPENGIVLATPLAHNLYPLHRSSHCGCQTGSLLLAIHASQQHDQQLATQGGRGRTLTQVRLIAHAKIKTDAMGLRMPKPT